MNNDTILLLKECDSGLKMAISSLDEVLDVIKNQKFKEICITSKNAGITDYIEDGINGYTFTSEDYEELSDKMKWIIENYESLDEIRDKARNTYLQNFTIGALGERLSMWIDRN